MSNDQQVLVGNLPAGGQEIVENPLTQLPVAFSARNTNIFPSFSPHRNDAVMQRPVCFRGRLVFQNTNINLSESFRDDRRCPTI